MPFLKLKTFLVLLFTVQASSAATLALNTSGDQVIGINDLTVDEQLWDARFIGFPSNPDSVPLYHIDFANKATEALLTALDSDTSFAGTMFDTDPAYTSGCNSSQACIMATAYSFNESNFNTKIVINTDGNHTDFQGAFSFDSDVVRPDVTFISWERANTISSVPVPPALWLMGSGIIGLVGLSRRKKSSRTA